MEKFDLIIIGGGPAGYLAGERAGAAGLKTAIIEKRSLGGVCLNEGCIPSKAFLNSAKIFDYALHGEKYGVRTTDATIDHSVVVARKNKVVKTLVAGVKAKLRHHSVTVITGTAQVTGKTQDGFHIVVENDTYIAKKILIATGSVPIIPPIPGVKDGLDAEFVLTNREILAITDPPKELIVIGGGVIGLEMASYFNTIGTKVTVIEMLDKIAGQTENEVSKILLGNCQKKGIVFKLGCKVIAVTENAVIFEENGEEITLSTDKILLSIGRKAFTDQLGLESIGVNLENGVVVTDEMMRTNIDGVYAAGDCNGRSMLAHTAYREAEVAINHILGKKDQMRYNAIPSVIYTNPEVACVGETIETALKKGYEAVETTVSMRYSGRYLAEVEGGNGICKLIVDQKNNHLIGVHMIGSYTSEIIYGAAMMIETKMKIDDIKEIVFPHPTVCEVIREALFEPA